MKNTLTTITLLSTVILASCGGGGSSSGNSSGSSSSKSVDPVYSVDPQGGPSCPNGELVIDEKSIIGDTQTILASCSFACANYNGLTHQAVIAYFESSVFTGGSWKFIQTINFGTANCKFN